MAVLAAGERAVHRASIGRLAALVLLVLAWHAAPVRAATGILGGMELITLPPQFAPGIIGNPSTYLYGLSTVHELSPEWNIRAGIFHTWRGDRQLLHVPLSMTYVVPNEYVIHLRPYIGLGFDLFLPSLPRTAGVGYNLHIRAGLDYVIDNQWVLNGNVALFIPLPGRSDTLTLNLGVFGLGIGFGYKL